MSTQESGIEGAVARWLLDELFKCYIEARKHKRSTQDEHTFEVNAMENIVRLRDDIMARRYKPSRGVAFIIHDPVVREIFAAPFRDRVVHHLLYSQVAGWWDRHFIYDSYSCRVGKGTLMGVKRVQHFIQKATQQGSREAYILKMDLQGYFMSLPRKRIYERVCWGLERQFDEDKTWLKEMLRYIWREVIFDDPTKNVKIRGRLKEWDELPNTKSLFCQPPGRGIVIGNLSSQLISNIYLDQLDRFIKFDLGYENYGRYVDDFIIVVPAERYAQALKDVVKINDFLHGLGLTLHPKKRYFQNAKHGVEFLGMRIYCDAIVPGKRFRGKFCQALRNYSMGLVDDDSIVSYLGYLKNIDGKKMGQKFFEYAGFDYNF